MVWAVSLSTTDLLIRSLFAILKNFRIRSLTVFSKTYVPLQQLVLYPEKQINDTLPK